MLLGQPIDADLLALLCCLRPPLLEDAGSVLFARVQKRVPGLRVATWG